MKADVVGDEEGEQERPSLDHLHSRKAPHEDHLALPQPERDVIHLSMGKVASSPANGNAKSYESARLKPPTINSDSVCN